MKDDLRVTIRLMPDKREVYDEFKSNVIDYYHSDICYVMTSLMEAFNTATAKSPNPNQEVTMQFLKQNVQINIGCNFNYNVKKARRIQTETTGPKITENTFLPNLIEQWDTMNEANKQFWRAELTNKGILQQPCDKSHTLLHRVKEKLRLWFSKVRS